MLKRDIAAIQGILNTTLAHYSDHAQTSTAIPNSLPLRPVNGLEISRRGLVLGVVVPGGGLVSGGRRRRQKFEILGCDIGTGTSAK